MNIETLHAAQSPKLEDFIPLAEHEAQTPATFFGGRPVLHYHTEDAELLFNEALFTHESVRDFILDAPVSVSSNHDDASAPSNSTPLKALRQVTVFVTSQSLLLLHSDSQHPSAAKTLSIPYPAISLHAIQTLPAQSPTNTTTTTPKQAAYLQLDPSFSTADATNPAHDDEDALPPLLELSIVPPTPSTTPPPSSTPTDQPTTPTQALYAALTRCAELHPTPAAHGDADSDAEGPAGGLGLAAGVGGGALGGGWITSENAHLFAEQFGGADGGDSEGREHDGTEELGPGAGTRRGREEEVEEVNGHGDGEGGAEADGVGGGEEDETKWRRTG